MPCFRLPRSIVFLFLPLTSRDVKSPTTSGSSAAARLEPSHYSCTCELKKKKAKPLILIVMVNKNQWGVLILTPYEVITLFSGALFGFLFLLDYLSCFCRVEMEGTNPRPPLLVCPLPHFLLNPVLFQLSCSLRFASRCSARPAGVKILLHTAI